VNVLGHDHESIHAERKATACAFQSFEEKITELRRIETGPAMKAGDGHEV